MHELLSKCAHRFCCKGTQLIHTHWNTNR